jgi:hypothetical protein
MVEAIETYKGARGEGCTVSRACGEVMRRHRDLTLDQVVALAFEEEARHGRAARACVANERPPVRAYNPAGMFADALMEALGQARKEGVDQGALVGIVEDFCAAVREGQ